jgi:PadR family transcriptional regulator PadR
VQSGPSKGSTKPDLSLACAWSEVRAWGSGHDEFFVHGLRFVLNAPPKPRRRAALRRWPQLQQKAKKGDTSNEVKRGTFLKRLDKPRPVPLHFDKSNRILPVEAKGEQMSPQRIDLPQGTLDLLILRTLGLEPQHGWAISERVQQISSDVLQIQQGSLYPALHRLERRGWIKARWGASENNRRAKYYELTRSGRKQLRSETAWRKLTAAVAQVLETA